MKVGILGSGEVAKTLGAGFLTHGHEVLLATRDATKLAEWQAKHSKARIGSFADGARFGEIVVLAVKGDAAIDAVRLAGAPTLAGKVVIDTTNPIAAAPPLNGVLKFFTSLDESLMERLQKSFPEVRFVKAFNSVGSARMVNPQYAGGPPTMFLCGNDAAAKHTVSGVLDQFGWEPLDMGSVEAARAIEPLCMLWCIPGFLRTSGRTPSRCCTHRGVKAGNCEASPAPAPPRTPPPSARSPRSRGSCRSRSPTCAPCPSARQCPGWRGSATRRQAERRRGAEQDHERRARHAGHALCS